MPVPLPPPPVAGRRAAWSTLVATMTRAAGSGVIALRYNTHREAFGSTLLTYQHYRERLMPVVAEGLALHHLTEDLIEQWSGDPGTSSPASAGRALYGLTSGAKAHASWTANPALVALRELCGGHGFHSHNAIVTARVDGEINTTFGGDNTVLCYESVRVAARESGVRDSVPERDRTPPLPAESGDGAQVCEWAAALLDTLAGRLLRRWQRTQHGALCRPQVHARCTARILRRWAAHSRGAADDAMRQLHAVTGLLSLTEHLVAEDLLDGAAIRELLTRRGTLSDRCADRHTEVLDLLEVPRALLGVPLAHPDYVRRTVTAAQDTYRLRHA